MRPPGFLITSLIVLVGCAGLRPHGATAPKPRPLFDFHAGFWVSLHQRLYAESGARPVPDPLLAPAAEEQATWSDAVTFYRQRYANRSLLTLLTEEELVHVNQALAAAESATSLAAVDLPAELRATLESAAPIYRHHRWPADEHAVRALIGRLTPPIARLGPALAQELARAYQTPWPEQPIRIDIASYGGPLGAYTIGPPPHITMGSHDPRHAGDAALEIVFHEASHVLVEPIERAIAAACAKQGKPEPPMLWHAILFYTTGELVRRQLGAGYVPYADHNGLWARSPEWTRYRPLLERFWLPWLDGKQPLSASIEQLVGALPQPNPSGERNAP